MDEKRNIDVKVNNWLTFHGPVVVGFVTFAGMGAFFLGVFSMNYWAQTVLISSILVYGMLALLVLTVTGLVAALWIRFVFNPMRSPIIHYQDNCIVVVDKRGNTLVKPLFPEEKPITVEAVPNQASEVLDMYAQGFTQETIAECMHISQQAVSKIVNKNGASKRK